MKGRVVRAAIFVMISGVYFAGARDGCAQTEEEMELMEARAAVQMATVKLAEQTAKLKELQARDAARAKKMKEVEAANLALAESLAAANAEADQYRESYSDLRLQMEALGVEALAPDASGIEQRLLKAVNDLRISEGEKQQLAEQLMRLTEATMNYMKTAVSPGPEGAEILEEELKRANEKLGLSRELAEKAEVESVDEAKVAGVKEEYGLVVLDAGEKAGFRIGMPLDLLRGNRVVATALVVDVRASIAGAVLQKLASEEEAVRVGDRVQVRTGETL